MSTIEILKKELKFTKAHPFNQEDWKRNKITALEDAIEKLEALEKAGYELPKKQGYPDTHSFESGVRAGGDLMIDACTPILAKKNEEIARLKEELARERVWLSACGCEALGYGDDKCQNGDYGYSASLEDVRKLRHQLTEKQKEIDELKKRYTCEFCGGTIMVCKDAWIKERDALKNKIRELQKVVDRIDEGKIADAIPFRCNVAMNKNIRKNIAQAIVKYLKEGVE